MVRSTEPQERMITWDKKKLKALKVKLKEAVKDKENSFLFEKNIYVIGYAKYLIKYLETQL